MKILAQNEEVILQIIGLIHAVSTSISADKGYIRIFENECSSLDQSNEENLRALTADRITVLSHA